MTSLARGGATTGLVAALGSLSACGSAPPRATHVSPPDTGLPASAQARALAERFAEEKLRIVRRIAMTDARLAARFNVVPNEDDGC
jgi:hypothetical protein